MTGWVASTRLQYGERTSSPAVSTRPARLSDSPEWRIVVLYPKTLLTVVGSEGSFPPSETDCQKPASCTTRLGVEASSEAMLSVPVWVLPASATKRTVTSSCPPAAIVAGSAGGLTSVHGPASVSPLTFSGPAPVLEMRSVTRSWTPFDGGLASVPMRLNASRSANGTPSRFDTAS